MTQLLFWVNVHTECAMVLLLITLMKYLLLRFLNTFPGTKQATNKYVEYVKGYSILKCGKKKKNLMWADNGACVTQGISSKAVLTGVCFTTHYKHFIHTWTPLSGQQYLWGRGGHWTLHTHISLPRFFLLLFFIPLPCEVKGIHYPSLSSFFLWT